ncbi:MAG: ThiF family adenylyltransferase [Vicinamibacterales bacterium]
MKLRISESDWTPFAAALRERRDVETAGFILAERLHDGEALLARHVVLVPDDGYLIRAADQLRIDPVAVNRIVRPARDGGLSVFTIHTHPGTSVPWFSKADDHGDARLMPSLLAQMDGPHGAMVLAGDTGLIVGRAWLPSGDYTELALSVVGQTIQWPTETGRASAGAPWFDRQRLALGQDGQAALRNLHVGIVGLGGTGSVAFAQLAHLGVGRITVIDGDRVEASNVSRVLGATIRDVGVAWKVDVAARYAEQLGLSTRVDVHRGHLGADVPTATLEACDVVLSCVDRHAPRALLNRLSYERAFPLIDMGSAFRVDTTGRLTAGVGRVVVVGPGRPCLGCWGHINPHRLRIEVLPAEERARQAAEGYIEGADVPEPSVIAFNTAVAGAAVVELLRVVTGFGGTDDPPLRLAFDFLTGSVRRNGLARSGACTICLPNGARHATLDLSREDALKRAR